MTTTFSQGLPAAFTARLGSELGPGRAERILHAMAAPKRPAYWVNPLRQGALPTFGEAVDGLEDVFCVAPEERERLMTHPSATAGRIYPLNPSSLLAIRALAPEPGEEVLDLAAAPGGKAVMIAARMENRGRLAAVEPIRQRYFRLRANLTRCGVTMARCYQDDGRNTGRKVPGRFDRVLLDAPCASEARFRAGDPASFAHWTPRKVKETVRKQRGLIASAYACLKPGGVLVYCTCSFGVAENEDIVRHLLEREDGARLEPMRFPLAHVEAGLMEHTYRVAPDALFDGFFLARVRKGRIRADA